MMSMVKKALDRAAEETVGEIPAHIRRDPRVFPGPETFAPPAQRRILAELENALAPAIAAPPPPLSEEARKMVSQQDISRAETVRDALRATAVSRLAEFDEWVLSYFHLQCPNFGGECPNFIFHADLGSASVSWLIPRGRPKAWPGQHDQAALASAWNWREGLL